METTKQGKVVRTKGGPKDMPDPEMMASLAKDLGWTVSSMRKFWENRQEFIDKNLLPVTVVDKKTGKKSPAKTETLNEKNIKYLLASAKSPKDRQKYTDLLKKGNIKFGKDTFKEDIRKAEQIDRIARKEKEKEEKAKKRNGGPVKKLAKGGMNKKTKMMGGSMYKKKMHAYAAGGMVKDMKLMRSK